MKTKLNLILALLLTWLCLNSNSFADVEGLSSPNVEGLTNPTVEGVTHGSSFCDCGAANVVWCWEITANDTTITNSGGCADGGYDTTASASGGVSLVTSPGGVGGYSILANDADYYQFDLPSGVDTEGTIQFDLYVDSWTDSGLIIAAYGSQNVNEIELRIDDSDDFTYNYTGNSNNVAVYTSDCALTEDNWYPITIKWRQGASNPSLSLSGGSGGNSSDTDLTDWTVVSSVIRFGVITTNASIVYMRKIKIFDNYQ